MNWRRLSSFHCPGLAAHRLPVSVSFEIQNARDGRLLIKEQVGGRLEAASETITHIKSARHTDGCSSECGKLDHK